MFCLQCRDTGSTVHCCPSCSMFNSSLYFFISDFLLLFFFNGDHSGVVYTYIASRNWIKDSQLLSHISQCTIYAYMLCIEMKTRKWRIVMVRVMLSKEQVRFILISMRLSSCSSFSLSPHIFFLSQIVFFHIKVTKQKTHENILNCIVLFGLLQYT